MYVFFENIILFYLNNIKIVKVGLKYELRSVLFDI